MPLIVSAVTAVAFAVSAVDVSAASAADAAPPAGTVGVADVTAARDGLTRFLAAQQPVADEQTTRLDGCPLVERKTVEGGLHEGGFADRLGDFGTEIAWAEYEALNPAMVGVWCLGDTDGDVADEDVGTLAAVFAVELVSPVTFPDIAAWGLPSGEFNGSTPAAGGELVSECEEHNGARACIAVWHAGGLVVGLLVADGASLVAQADVDAMVVDLVPDVLHSLAQA